MHYLINSPKRRSFSLQHANSFIVNIREFPYISIPLFGSPKFIYTRDTIKIPPAEFGF